MKDDTTDAVGSVDLNLFGTICEFDVKEALFNAIIKYSLRRKVLFVTI